MLLTLNIEEKATSLPGSSWIGRQLLKIFHRSQMATSVGLDDIYLTAEGFLNHVKDLDSKTAAIEQAKVKRVVSVLHTFIDVYEGTALQTKYSQTLRMLYRLEASLHKVIYRDVPVTPTPDYIKQGLAHISMEARAKVMAKYAG